MDAAVRDTRGRTELGIIAGKGAVIRPTNIRFPNAGADIPLVNWKEMVLIRAEAAGGQTAIDLVNSIRQADQLPLVTYADPANAAQIERMIIENGIMLRGLANLLVKKGVVAQDELDEELDRLYEEIEEYEEDEERE